MWHVLFELDEQYATGWTLIGAQMVALHAAEHSRTPPRSSEDADVLADARILKPKPHHIARALLDRGFDPEITSAQIAHRFVRGRVSIDVLAPDGLDDASKALRTVPPNVTVQVPAGLRRSSGRSANRCVLARQRGLYLAQTYSEPFW
jgi:hypothetical protein